MNLLEYQRALLRTSFASQPDAADLAALGSADSFLLYRHMIRTRLSGMAKLAFKQTRAELGEAGFDACCQRYLSERPPVSPLIRDVVADFGPFAQADAALLSRAPAYAVDLIRFEETKWRLGYAAASMPKLGEGGVRELDFEGTPVLNPLLRVLTLSYPVHKLPDLRSRAEPRASTLALVAAPVELLMYRPPTSDEVRWYIADAFFVALLRRAQEVPASPCSGASTLAELVRGLAEERKLVPDMALLETLASSLTLALERGVLLGVR